MLNASDSEVLPRDLAPPSHVKKGPDRGTTKIGILHLKQVSELK